MRILITGTSSGIGCEVAKFFLEKGHEVIGIDLNKSTINNKSYTHYIADIKNEASLPEIKNVEILINNAGLQNSIDDIDNNLKGTIYVTEKYIKDNKALKSVLFNASASSFGETVGIALTISSNKSPRPFPCSAETLTGAPNPKE